MKLGDIIKGKVSNISISITEDSPKSGVREITCKSTVYWGLHCA